jgi:motility quorum-sensing regulator/GCU-specific mRNA interferase toxin
MWCQIAGDVTEKRKPTFDLATIQSEFCEVQSLRLTNSAQKGAFAVGLATLEAIVDLIQTITREHFYKSMTSYADHRIWQDVYHVPFEAVVLYVKFTVDDDGHFLISLKRKD